MRASLRRVHALVLRYVLLVGRDPSRVVDLMVWPFIDITVWGFLTMYVNQTGMAVPNAVAVFLGAAILWNLFIRAAQDASVSFLEDVWARSLVTLFASPLRLVEFGVSLLAVGVIKVVLALVLMGIASWFLYAFNVLTLGPWLLPFAANLVVFGYILGLLALSLVVRFGGRWQIVAWGLPWMVMPFSSVYWPESVLPPAMRAIAQASPMNHVFEGMRGVVSAGEIPLGRLATATIENLVYLLLTTAIVARTFRGALDRGALPRLR
jgi:ABC-2 type transport system permease protein